MNLKMVMIWPLTYSAEQAPWKQGESGLETGRNHVVFEFAAGGKN
jgi:hypothetical protein